MPAMQNQQQQQVTQQSVGYSSATLSYSSTETSEINNVLSRPAAATNNVFNFPTSQEWGLQVPTKDCYNPVLTQTQPEQCSSDSEQCSTVPALISDVDLLDDDLLNEAFDLDGGVDFFLQSPVKKDEELRIPQFAGLPVKLDLSSDTTVRHECEV